jgi:hypothetical protein
MYVEQAPVAVRATRARLAIMLRAATRDGPGT